VNRLAKALDRFRQPRHAHARSVLGEHGDGQAQNTLTERAGRRATARWCWSVGRE
jgi:hypothetical protein